MVFEDKKEGLMTTERYVRLFAGSMILISLALAVFFSDWWLLLTCFVGLNLFQSAITKWCLLEDILKKFGVKS